MLRLKEVIISITNRCNLRCKMCEIPFKKTEELSTLQLKKAIKDASRLGVQTIVFSGGEPFLRNDIIELIFWAKQNRLSACVTSNGTLFDEEKVGRLAVSGVNVVNISIEGDACIHDYLRGEGNFDKAVSALELLRKYNIESTVAATVSRYNYEHLPCIVELAHNYGATTVIFQPFSRIFLRDSTADDEFFIDKEKKERLWQCIKEAVALANRYGIVTNPPNYLAKIPAYLCNELIAPNNTCSALWTSCPINAEGEVYPCWKHTGREMLVGNIVQEGLAEIWFSRQHKRVREEILRKRCSGCLMSCYDEVFGQNRLQKILAKKIKRIIAPRVHKKLKNRIIQRAKSEITWLKTRFNFYKSYRGSYAIVIKRLLKKVKRDSFVRKADKNTEIQVVLKELQTAKEILKKRIYENR